VGDDERHAVDLEGGRRRHVERRRIHVASNGRQLATREVDDPLVRPERLEIAGVYGVVGRLDLGDDPRGKLRLSSGHVGIGNDRDTCHSRAFVRQFRKAFVSGRSPVVRFAHSMMVSGRALRGP
jgi:hypothetical protein